MGMRRTKKCRANRVNPGVARRLGVRIYPNPTGPDKTAQNADFIRRSYYTKLSQGIHGQMPFGKSRGKAASRKR